MNDDSTQDIDQFILDSMPHFIAVQYQKLLAAELPKKKMEYALHVYELGLRALAMGLVSQYLIRDAEHVKDLALNELLYTSLPNATLEVWQQILFDTLKAYKNKKKLLFMPELYDFYWDHSKSELRPKAVEDVFTRLTRIRNDVVHSGREVTLALLAETLELLRTVLSNFRFFGEYDLIRITKRDGKLYWYDRHTGTKVVAVQTPLQYDGDLQTGWFYLSKQNHEFLNLHPLVIFWQDPSSHTAVYEQYFEDTKILKYLLANLWEQPVNHQSVNNFIKSLSDHQAVSEFIKFLFETIDQQKRAVLETRKLTWPQLQRLAHTISGQRMASVMGKYSANLYLQRNETWQAFQNFLASDKSCFVLIGKSGVGKSNFVLSLRDTYGIETSEVCLLLYNGAKLNAQETITTLVSRDFNERLRIHGRGGDEGIESVWHEIARIENIENHKIIAIFDAVNENADAKSLLRQIDQLVADSVWPWLKIVVTARPEAWRSIKRGVSLSEDRYYREPGQAISEIEMKPFSYSQEIGHFTEGELPQAYAKYQQMFELQTPYEQLRREVKQALQDPFALRITARTYKNRNIPHIIKQGELILNYVDNMIETERMTMADLWFLENELMPLMVHEDHYTPIITASQIGATRTTDGRNMFELIHGEGLLSDGRRVNQTYSNLVDAEILTQQRRGSAYEISFKYERFYEHFAGRQLMQLAGKSSHRELFYRDIAQKIQKFPFLWGALKTALKLEIQEGRPRLLQKLAVTIDQNLRSVVSSALTEHGMDHPDVVKEILFALLALIPEQNSIFQAFKRVAFQQTNELSPELKTAKNLAIEVAFLLSSENSDFAAILQTAALDSSASIRTFSVQYTYYLWKQDHPLGHAVLDYVSQKVRGAIGLPNAAALESSIGISLLMLFDGYKDEDVQHKLRQTWRLILEDLLFINPNKVGQKGYSLTDQVRNLILSIVVKFTLQTIANAENTDTTLGVSEFNHFFQRDAKSRGLVARLAPYVDPARGDIAEIKDLLFQAMQGYDIFTACIVWIVLLSHGAQDFEKILPTLDELFYKALSINRSSLYAGFVSMTLGNLIDTQKKFDQDNVRHMIVYWLTLYNANRLQYQTATKNYIRFTGVGDHVAISHHLYGHIDSPHLQSVIEQAKAERNTELIIDCIDSAYGSLRQLGTSGEKPQLALQALKYFLDYKDERVSKAISDMLADIKVYSPDDVEDFLVNHEIPEAMRLEVQHKKTTENIDLLIQVKGYFFLVNVILQSKTLRDEFIIPLFQSLATAKDFSSWAQKSFKRLINLIYGSEVLHE